MAALIPAVPEEIVPQDLLGESAERESRRGSGEGFFPGAALNRSPRDRAGEDSEFSIARFLESEQQKDLLRLSTAGSVDDGKSTLIGRLLYDSRNVYEDHVRSVTKKQGSAGQSSIDFAQLTDGLRAEREQGITIDVAYRYFSTERRKFIIADTPGHEQYTRNMATGASTADLAIILIDATHGIVTQSRRHVYITSLLGIRHLVAAINKMDLVGFSAAVFTRIERQFKELVGQLGHAEVTAIPISALDGDNVVERSRRMPWYRGPSLLEHLEAVPTRHQSSETGFRLPVQRVIRPKSGYPQPNFRGFAGQIAGGSVRVGDRVTVLPSGRKTRVASICTFDGDLQEARAPQSIALTLEGELDISRGDILVAAEAPPSVASAFEASLVWLDSKPLDSSRSYLLKHASQTMNARVTAIRHRVNMRTMEQEGAVHLEMNDIGLAEIETVRPIFFDSYEKNRNIGSFILIDPETNATAAAGMIQRAAVASSAGASVSAGGAVLMVAGSELASAAEAALHNAGYDVVRTRLQDPKVWQSLAAVGVIALVEAPPETAQEGIWLAASPLSSDNRPVGFAAGTPIEPLFLPDPAAGSEEAVARILPALRGMGILPKKADGRI